MIFLEKRYSLREMPGFKTMVKIEPSSKIQKNGTRANCKSVMLLKRLAGNYARFMFPTHPS